MKAALLAVDCMPSSGGGRSRITRRLSALHEGFLLALVGVGLGLIGAFVLTRFLSTMLFGVTATDRSRLPQSLHY